MQKFHVGNAFPKYNMSHCLFTPWDFESSLLFFQENNASLFRVHVEIPRCTYTVKASISLHGRHLHGGTTMFGAQGSAVQVELGQHRCGRGLLTGAEERGEDYIGGAPNNPSPTGTVWAWREVAGEVRPVRLHWEPIRLGRLPRQYSQKSQVGGEWWRVWGGAYWRTPFVEHRRQHFDSMFLSRAKTGTALENSHSLAQNWRDDSFS